MAKTRQPISKKLRFEVFKRDSFTCQYCGESAPTVVLHADHIHPVKKEGKTDLLNLITSCIDCNLGKGARLLADDAAVTKQKAQLDELQERREQIEMMLEWRDGLKSLDDDQVNIAVRACDDLTPGWDVKDGGKQELRKLIKKFGLNIVLDAIEKSEVYLKYDENDELTSDSVNEAFNKLGGICQIASLPQWKQDLYHIRNIARKRANGSHWQPRTSADLLDSFTRAYESGVSLDDLKAIACRGLNYNQLTDAIFSAQESLNG